MTVNRSLDPWTWGTPFGFVQGVESTGATRVVHLAGQGDQSHQDGSPLHHGDIAAQALGAIDSIERLLGEADLTLADVVRLNHYTTDVDAFLDVLRDRVAPRLHEAGCRASSTLVGVTRLAFPEMLIEIEATAIG